MFVTQERDMIVFEVNAPNAAAPVAVSCVHLNSKLAVSTPKFCSEQATALQPPNTVHRQLHQLAAKAPHHTYDVNEAQQHNCTRDITCQQQRRSFTSI